MDLVADDGLEAIVEQGEGSLPSSPSSSESWSSGEENGSGSQGESEGESSDTDLEERGKRVLQGAKEVKGEEGFKPVAGRASRRLAQKERQRELERERAEREAQVKEEARRNYLRQHQAMAKATGGRHEAEAGRATGRARQLGGQRRGGAAA